MNRASIAALVVTVLALLSSLTSYQISTQLVADPFRISAAKERFSGARELLPRTTPIGYLTDMPMRDNTGTVAYMAARYAIAPRALVPSGKTATEWAIGNFAHPADFAAIGAQSGYGIVRDFGNGVVVYRRR